MNSDIEKLKKEFQKLKIEVKGWAKEDRVIASRKEAIREAVQGFNPDKHVIVTKEQLDITSQLKGLYGMVEKVNDVSKKVTEVHAINIGKYCNPEKRLTAKEKREAERAELEQIRLDAHTRALNKGVRIRGK